MAIEKVLEKILEELQTLNSKIPTTGTETPAPPAAETSKKGKKDEPAAGPTPTSAPAISREALGEKLVAFAKTNMDAAKAILAKYKATKLADVAESDYAAVLKDVEAATAAPAETSIL